MKAYDTFSPSQYSPDPVMESSVKEHRKELGSTPRYRILRQWARTRKFVRTTVPETWIYFNQTI